MIPADDVIGTTTWKPRPSLQHRDFDNILVAHLDAGKSRFWPDAQKKVIGRD